MGRQLALGYPVEQVGHVGGVARRVALDECAPEHALHVASLQQQEVQRDFWDPAACEADHKVAAFPGDGAQRRLGEVAADGIVDYVHAAALGEALQPVPEGLGRVVERKVGPVPPGKLQLVGRGRAGDDTRAHEPAEFDGRQADAPGRAEHGQGLAGLQPRAVLERMERGAVGDGEPRRLLVADARGDAHQALGARDHSLPARAPAQMGDDALALRPAAHAPPKRRDHAGTLRPRRERKRGLVLVTALDDERVEEIERGRAHLNHHLAGAGPGLRQVLDDEGLRPAERLRQHCSHDPSSRPRPIPRDDRTGDPDKGTAPSPEPQFRRVEQPSVKVTAPCYRQAHQPLRVCAMIRFVSLRFALALGVPLLIATDPAALAQEAPTQPQRAAAPKRQTDRKPASQEAKPAAAGQAQPKKSPEKKGADKKGDDKKGAEKKGAERKGAKSAAGPGGAQATLLASFGDWNAYVSQQGRAKVCYALSKPKDQQPKELKRDSAYLFVSFRPSENVRNEIAVVMGFAAKDGNAEAAIGKTTYALVTKDQNAWVQNPAEENQVVATMSRGPNLVLKAVSKRGNKVSDTYSLNGFGPALDRARKECS